MDFITTQDLAITGATFVILMMAYATIQAMFNRRDLNKRIDVLKSDRGAGKEKFKKQPGVKLVFNNLLSRNIFKNAQQSEKDQMDLLFQRAGWHVQEAYSAYYMSKVLTTGLMVLIAILLVLTKFSNATLAIKILMVIGLSFFGWVSFDQILKTKTSWRYKSINKNFSDALDMMVICVEAGLNLERSFERVAVDFAKVNPELGKELSLTAVELSLIENRRLAFENFSKRVPLPVIREVMTTLIQSEEQGTPIASTLKIISEEVRKSRMLQIEKKAASMAVLLSIPTVLFTLPLVLIIVGGPAGIKAMSASGKVSSAESRPAPISRQNYDEEEE